MGAQTQRLIAVLGDLSELLRSDGETHWRAWILEARSRLEGSDFAGIEYLLDAYGGMGSFNDLVLGQCADGGSFALKPNANELNERLDSLRTEAWTLAKYIERNHELSGAEQAVAADGGTASHHTATRRRRTEPMNVRAARLSDARDIASVHVRSWQSAYRGIVPDAYLRGLSIDERTVSWRANLAAASPEVWVAEEHAEVVGWIAFGKSRDTDAAADTGEVEALYVLPGYWSTGVGRALWERAYLRLQARGFRRATLWVLADNARGIRFYSAVGFAPSLERAIDIGGQSLLEVRYEVPIG